MQAILIADYSFTPLEYWRHVSLPARQFVNRCLTIDPLSRMTAHEALAHPWITGEAEEGDEAAKKGKTDLLPTVKKNFNARRTLHAAIDTIRAINQLRAGGAAAMGSVVDQAGRQQRAGGAGGGGIDTANGANDTANGGDGAQGGESDPMEGVEKSNPNPTSTSTAAAEIKPHEEHVNHAVGQLGSKDTHDEALNDPRGNARGQT